jgi:beta-lactamase regulating signal transducer with metallopeptidase domain
VAGVAGLMLLAVRARSGAVRHAVWTSVLCAMLLMPVLPQWVPALAVSMPQIVAQKAMRTPAAMVERPPALRMEATPAMPLRQAAASNTTWKLVALGVYLLVTCGLLARLFSGWLLACRIARECRQMSEAFHESDLVAAPMTIGIAAPKIVLPLEWRTWTGMTLRGVLAHEAAHARRRDPLVRLLAQINCSVFWFHPLAWWLERSLTAAAEEACDDAGIRAVGGNREYAGILLQVAENVWRGGGRLCRAGMGMADGGMLSQRMDRILRGETMQRVSPWRKALLGAACGLAILLAAACHTAATTQPAAEAPVDEAEKQTEAARHLTADEVASLEASAAKDPNDVESRARLLIFYARGHYPVETRRVMLWMIQQHPEGIVVWESKRFPPMIDEALDPEGYAQGRKLWLARLVRPHIPTAELQNAVAYFKFADGAISQKLLLRASVNDDPDALGGVTDEYYKDLARSPQGVTGKPKPAANPNKR